MGNVSFSYTPAPSRFLFPHS
jgi:hypothetical protein